MNNYDEHFKFIVKDGVDFPNAEFIHPLKQLDGQILYEELLADENIVLFVVFGSAVDFRCNSYSDMDIYLERKDREVYHKFSYEFKTELDVLYDIDDKESGIWKSIDRDGIIIFDRR